MSASDGGSDPLTSIAWEALPYPLPLLRPVIWPLVALGQAIKEAGSWQKAILAFLTTYIVTGALNIGQTIIGFVFQLFNPILMTIGLTQRSVTSAFRPVGDAILGFTMTINDAVREVAGVTGPAAPIVTTLLVVAIAYVTFRVLVALAGEVPGGSTVVDLLRLR